MVSLHNSIIEPRLIDSDYTQRTAHAEKIQVYVSRQTTNIDLRMQKGYTDSKVQRITCREGELTFAIFLPSVTTRLHRRLQRFRQRCYLLR